MLKIENVSKIYSADGNVGIGLHKVSAKFAIGEIVAIVGESGSGKSTFLNVVSGMDTFEEGEIYFGELPLSAMSKNELENYRKQNVGFIFQNYNLIDSYTVLQNVLLSLELRGISGKEAKTKAIDILIKVGLEKRIHHKGTKLSGGEKQRVVIARALASDAPIIACDEPTGNLDSKTGAEIIALLKEISQDKLILIVTHNYDEVAGIATRKIKFHDGNIIEDVTLQTVVKTDTVIIENEESITKPLEKKQYFNIALRNILSVPKKTIFTFIVFSVIVYAIFFLYMTLVEEKNSFSASANPYYSNVLEERMIGYDYKGGALDLQKIKDKMPKQTILEHSFVEDTPLGNFYDVNNSKHYSTYLLSFYDSKYGLEGKLPAADNEIILGLPEYLYSYYKDEWIGSSISLSKYDSDHEYLVTGAFVDKTNYSTSTIGIHGTKAFTEFHEKKIVGEKYHIQVGSAEGTNFLKERLNQVEIDDSLKPKEIKLHSPNEKMGEMIPFFKDSLSIELQMEFVFNSYKLTDYTLSYEKVPYLSIAMSQETYDMLSNITFSVSCYSTSRSTRDDFQEGMESLGYNALSPSKYTGDDEYILFMISYIFSMIGILFAIIILYFFSYIVLSHIYSSKNKDYIIMRTLGINKKALSRIVLVETEIIAVSASLFILILYGISKIFHLKIFFGLTGMTFATALFFILTIFVFGLFLTQRFNKRIYKFSIHTSLRKERANRD